MSKIKLYEIETEIVMYVLATDEDAAKDIAMCSIKDEVDSLSAGDFSVNEAKDSWHGHWTNGIPYSDDDDDLEGLDGMTVKEIMVEFANRASEQADREAWEAKQLKLFPELEA